MYSFDEISNLIKVGKHVVPDRAINREVIIRLAFPVRDEITLCSDDEDEVYFRWIISQGKKDTLKLTLFIMEKDTNVGLCRVDYVAPTSVHKNPDIVIESVPSQLARYAGAIINGSHVHYQVDGYNQLDWCLPISDVSDLVCDTARSQNEIADRIESFAKYINLKTPIIFEADFEKRLG